LEEEEGGKVEVEAEAELGIMVAAAEVVVQEVGGVEDVEVEVH